MHDPAAEPAGIESRGVLARNALFLALAQLLSTACAVALSAALGRALGPAEFGLFFLVTSMAGFAYVVLEWGQTQYVVREIAQQPRREGALLGTTLAARVLGTALAAGLTAAVAQALGYDARTCGLAALFVATMIPFFLSQALSLVFRARERMQYDAVAAVVDRALTLAATLLAVAVGAGVFGAAIAVGVGGLASLLTATVLLRRLGMPRLSVDHAEAKAMLLGGAAIVLTNVESSVQPYIDAIVLSKLAPAEAVGWYGAARTFVGTLVAPAIILSVAAYPRLSRAATAPGELRRELRLVMKPLIGLGVLACVGTFLFAQAAVDLVYGNRGFAAAGTILKVLAPGLLLLFADNMLCAAVVAIGRPKPLAFAKLFNIAVCAGLSLLLVPAFQAERANGGIGLAIASGVSEIIMLGAALLILPAGSLDLSLLFDLGRALAAGAVTALLFELLPAPPLLVGVPACVLVFGVLSLAFRLVRPAELRAFPRLLRRPR